MVIRCCPVRFASARTRLRPSSRRSIVRSLPPLLPTLSAETVVWSVGRHRHGPAPGRPARRRRTRPPGTLRYSVRPSTSGLSTTDLAPTGGCLVEGAPAGNHAPSHALTGARYPRTDRRPTTALPVPWSPARPSGGLGSCEGVPRTTASILGDPRGGSAFEAPGLLGTFLARPRDCAACCRSYRAAAFRRRSLWLDRASVRRALAVPPRGSSHPPATAATSSRCSLGASVRSRRLSGAAA